LYNSLNMDTSSPDNIRVLLADPDTAFCISARHTLEKHGFSVLIAHDGADLLARFVPDQFDVVVAGVSLRRPNGLDILRHIKKHSPATPVILLCEDKSEETAEAGIREGAFAYLHTSTDDLGELADTIMEAIETPQENLIISDLDAPVATKPNAPEQNEYPIRLMNDLIRSTATKPLAETLQLVVASSAKILKAAYAVVLRSNSAAAFQAVTPYDSESENDSMRAFIENPKDGFAVRIAKAGKTLIDAMPGVKKGYPSLQLVGTPMFIGDQLVGILIAYALPTDQPIDLERVTWFEMFAAQGALTLEFAHIQDENAHLAPDDPMTGVLKREVFLEMADREFRRSWRYNHSLTSIVVDVDSMSILNLKYGREFGDVVLREVANVCRNIVRSVDLIGRYEADTLTMLLLMTGQDGARTVAERLRVGVNAIRLGSSEGLVQITATIGVCVYPRNGCASIFDLLTLTANAQQMARRLGPNQIVYA